MTRFLHHLVITVATASFPLAAAAVATSAVTVAAPGITSPRCDPVVTKQCVSSAPHCDLNWSRNVWTGECHPQPVCRTGMSSGRPTPRPTHPSTSRRLLPRRHGQVRCSRDGTKAASIGSGPGSDCGDRRISITFPTAVDLLLGTSRSSHPAAGRTSSPEAVQRDRQVVRQRAGDIAGSRRWRRLR